MTSRETQIRDEIYNRRSYFGGRVRRTLIFYNHLQFKMGNWTVKKGTAAESSPGCPRTGPSKSIRIGGAKFDGPEFGTETQ